MNKKHHERINRPWLVVAADSPTNGVVERCRWLLSALYVAFVFRYIAKWHVRIVRNPRNYSKMVKILDEVRATWWKEDGTC